MTIVSLVQVHLSGRWTASHPPEEVLKKAVILLIRGTSTPRSPAPELAACHDPISCPSCVSTYTALVRPRQMPAGCEY